ncbi:MAG: DEAD/DEAH box helicase [Desulfococcaceae bacterium]
MFHSLIHSWFATEIGTPTDIQTKAWPEIAAGRHVLVTAPTGSGKTLTAFLWAIHQLVSGEWATGQTRVLYVSPLKALNNDVQKNLLRPLVGLKSAFEAAGEPFPDIRVLTRSGDTPSNERRTMARRPPEVLITTPESLNILVSSKGGRRMLTGIATVILDEIHAVAGTKRGVHLITAVDRLVPLTGEFQRIALSATVRPLSTVAAFVGGYEMTGDPQSPRYRPREVAVIQSEAPKALALTVRFPEDARETLTDDSWWPSLVRAFKAIITENRATLLFANSRRLTEKVTRLINEGEDKELAYAHHGSLSKEIRLAVEEKLKRAELKAIVATNSLELGIDIGELDAVVLVQSPRSVSSTVQRVGRAGHGVGETSRGMLFPTHGRDFLDAAVLARAVAERDIEPIQPVTAPLDVLAQIILAMAGVETWDIDALFAFLRTSRPFHDLSRRQYDLTLEMLAGRYAEIRLRELNPRISLDRTDNTVTARSGQLRLVYMAGGTIPDRGYYDLRMADSRAKIGELDEEFVWERSVAETFALGAQTWKILKITANDVEVAPSSGRPGIIPFWRAEAQNREWHLSEKIGRFLEDADIRLKDPDFLWELREDWHMDDTAARELLAFLQRQRDLTESPLPHRHHLLIEHFDDPLNRSDSKQVILHTLWGGRINRPFAMALSAAWERRHRYPLEAYTDDDGILLILPHAFSARDLLDLVTPENLEPMLRERLPRTGFFGARFRENAGRALLLPRVTFKKRMPLWLNRLRAKKLLEAATALPDFPILLETWRTCLRDEFDLENLKMLLDELAGGAIRVSETVTGVPSPFSGNLIWQQTNYHMYEDDTPGPGAGGGLTDSLFRELTGGAHLRPRIPDALIRVLESKLQRTAPGYAPKDSEELLDWAKARVLIPEEDWKMLLDAVERDHGLNREAAIQPIAGKLLQIRLPGAAHPGICAVETVPRLLADLGVSLGNTNWTQLVKQPKQVAKEIRGNLERAAKARKVRLGESEDDIPGGFPDLLFAWLSFHGPIQPARIRELFGVSPAILDAAMNALLESGRIVRDRFRENDETIEICDRENLEILLRMLRRSRQPAFTPLPPDQLILFLATFQGVARPGESMEDLQDRLESLFGFPAPAGAWEESILPARLDPYYPVWLDSLLSGTDLTWFGCGNQRLSFAFPEDLELFQEPVEKAESDSADESPSTKWEAAAHLLPGVSGRFGFFDIASHTGLATAELTRTLWDLAWQGALTTDTFEVVRKGIQNRFKPFEPKPSKRSGRTGRRGQFNRWKTANPMAGNWGALPRPSPPEDPMAAQETDKDRVRQLLRRYGILFRELTAREPPTLGWGRLFRTLRLMELSGEILSGRFFEGLPGIQFISHEAFRMLNRPLPEDAVYWMYAADPASLCGIKMDRLKTDLPPRSANTHLVFHGSRLVIISKRTVKELEIFVPPDHPFLERYLSFCKALLNRRFNPMRRISVEVINGEASLASPYAEELKKTGFATEYKGLEMRRAV